MHPRYEIKKTYEVESYNPIPEKAITEIKKGILLEDGKTSPAKVKRVRPDLIQITIHEGKNRIIRRMMQKLGIRIKTLERIKIGSLSLGNLQPGRYRSLSEKEQEKIFNNH